MILKKEFTLRQVVDTWIVLPVGGANADFNGMLTLNSSGALLWKALEQGCDRDALALALTSEYIVSLEQAQKDVDDFLKKLQAAGCLEL